MLKVIVIVVLAMCVYSVQGRCGGPPCKPNFLPLCAADKHQVHCQHMTQCELDKENCKRRHRNHPILISVALKRCSKLKRPSGKGPCAPVSRHPRNARPNCHHIKCNAQNVGLVCARTKDNMCQLLRKCDLDRKNCERGHSQRSHVVDKRRCAGMKHGQKLQRCKALPKRG